MQGRGEGRGKTERMIEEAGAEIHAGRAAGQ